MHLSMDNTLLYPYAKLAGCMLYSNVPERGDLGSLPRANPRGGVRDSSSFGSH